MRKPWHIDEDGTDAPMIATERLILRPWKDEDLAPFAAMNADPQVREFFPGRLTKEQSDASARRIQAACSIDRFCLFAAELRATDEFIGFIGLTTLDFSIPGVAQPTVEIGWRLARAHWGKGLATEGAQAAVRYAFDTLRLKEIVSITVPANIRSRRVMEKIGMKHIPALDFDHPHIPEGHPLRRHVLYLLKSESFSASS
ncbi:MAG: GNAT family N-acetyltransferase [Candidatus Acidiferrales bacterium]